MKIKILLMGNIPGNNPKSIGGANTYTQALLDKITQKNEIEVSFLPLRSRWYKGGQIIDFFFLMFKTPFKLAKHDVISIHATWDFHLTIGPFIILLSRMFNKKTVYHFFGGQFHKMYDNYPWIIKWWLNITIFKADYKLMETKRMITYFKNKSFDGFVWFPNSRKSIKGFFKSKEFSKKFVFISRVTPTKGVDTILEVSNLLSEEYKVDIYGPLDYRYYSKEYFKNHKANYLGKLKPEEVIKTLDNYDVLLLPTFHPGEGYPGVFIEAMSIGKPIICSKWNALDELVEDNINGKLVQPKSTTDLKNAMEFFDKSNYKSLAENAKKKFNFFNIDNTVDKLLKLYLEDD